MAETRTYAFAAWLFLRLLGVIYLVAFVSLAKQIRGLAGRHGILPACESLAAKNYGKVSRFWRLPTLCWLSTSDRFLLSLCWGGAALAGMLIAGVAPLPLLILLWICYLSLFNITPLFLGYQWDVLLLEAGFLAIFLAPMELWPRIGSKPPSALLIWLFWWLLFRLMFSSGFVKLRSGDKSWRDLTALCYHYQTQPLPTPAAWYAHQLPFRFHKISTAIALVIELLGPVFMLGPEPVRHVVCAAFIALMLLIELTGNYAFFNLLAIALSLLLLDDEIWRSSILRFIPGSATNYRGSNGVGFFDGMVILVAIVVFFISCDVVAKLFRQSVPWPRFLIRLLELAAPFHLVSSYGLFAVMTTERPEIIVEGSDDGVKWQAYEFKWKPGAVDRAPGFVAPHQPRLDWQMWFAALGYCENNPWFVRFLFRLLEGSQPVLQLLKTNPFAGKPPRYIRASVYNYRFTNGAQCQENQAWWVAERRGTYCPPLEVVDRQVNSRSERLDR